MNAYEQLNTKKANRVHELYTLGGYISPVEAIAREIIHPERGVVLPEEFKHQLQRIIAELEALLKKVLDKANEENLAELETQDFRIFYQQRFVEGKSLLHEFVALLDKITESAALTLPHHQRIKKYRDEFKGWLAGYVQYAQQEHTVE